MGASDVLLVRFGSLGDVVLACAAGQALLRAQPDRAITNTVRPASNRSIASCTSRSDSVSSDDVASSRIRIGGSVSSARAMARRWR